MNKNLVKKIAMVAAGGVLVAIFFALDLQQYLTLNYLKESQARFAELYNENPVMVIGGYMAIYILVTALSLPGAAILTLAGGALFGLATGLSLSLLPPPSVLPWLVLWPALSSATGCRINLVTS